jgi:hypothetical protein
MQRRDIGQLGGAVGLGGGLSLLEQEARAV